MVKEDKSLSARVRSELQNAIGDRRFQTWFDGRVELRLDGEAVLVVVVGSPLERDCLQRQFAEELLAACERSGAGARRLAFRVQERQARKEREATAGVSDAQGKGGIGSATLISRERPPTGASLSAGLLAADSQVGPTTSAPSSDRGRAMVFSEFVIGEGSMTAASIAQQAAAGEPVASPLLIWGPTGVGKTHLLRAIRQEVRRRRIRALYLTAEQFTTGFIEAVHGRGLPSFRHKHRGVDLLLIDDLQFFLGKAKTLEELQHTLDTLMAEGAQIVLASDRPPSALHGLGGEIVSRLSGGVSVEIEAPDFATRKSLLRRSASASGMVIDDDVVDAVAGTIVGGVREMAGVLNRLRVAHELLGDEITPASARRLAEETNSQTTPRVKMDDIQSAVCRVFGVERGDLRSGRRTKAVTEPRMLAMWLARKYTRAAWSEIGAHFGRRSHSTVISACRRVDSLLSREARVRGATGDAGLQDALRRIERELRTA